MGGKKGEMGRKGKERRQEPCMGNLCPDTETDWAVPVGTPLCSRSFNEWIRTFMNASKE